MPQYTNDELDTASTGESPWTFLPPGTDVWFSDTLHAHGEALRKLINGFIALQLHHENKTAPRKRRRKPKDQKAFEFAVEVVVCNLVAVALKPTRSGRISISLHKGRTQSRYAQQVSPKVLGKTIDGLGETDALKLVLGQRGQFQSTIEPTEWFIAQVRQAGVTSDDLDPGEGPEVILLTQSTKHTSGPGKDRHNIEYEDTEVTANLRQQVIAINVFLRTADIDYLGDHEASDRQFLATQGPLFNPLPEVRLSDVALRRHFKLLEGQEVRFDQYGRLYGGWWITLQKERRRYIRLQEEPIAYLDFQSMNVRLAYAHVGQVAAEGDMYDLRGHWPSFSLQRHREAIKTTMSAMWFRGDLKRFPRGGRTGLPKNATMETIVAAIRSKHPALAPILGHPLGYTFAFMESNVLLRVLQAVNASGIVALPLHDAIMVPGSRAIECREIMESVTKELYGFPFAVSVE